MTFRSKLTDDDLATAEGKFDTLSGLLRQRYGYTKDKADDELERFDKRFVYIDEDAERR